MLGVIGILLSSCANGNSAVSTTFPETTGYLIAGLNENGNFAGNGLLVFEPTDFSNIREVPLPTSRIETARIAPDGNLWLGLSGGTSWNDDRVVVLDKAGKKLSEIHACLFPTVGIWFYHQSAIIVCRDTGFFGTIAEINLSSFTVERRLQIKISDQQPFMGVSSGLSGSTLGVIGLTAGPEESLAYSVLSIVNLDTFSVSRMMDLGAGANIWSVLPYEGRFLLLNVQGKDDPQKRDLIWVTPNDNKIEKTVTLQTSSPLWGVIADETLYSFHNSGWNSISVSPDRFLCSTDLGTYQQSCFPLSEGFDSYSGMVIIGGNPCITHWGDDQPSGLYCLENGKLALKIKYEAASLVALSTRE